jgi:hypothetical protein
MDDAMPTATDAVAQGGFHYAGGEFLEEKALLRNLVMQLDGLELLLRKSQIH